MDSKVFHLDRDTLFIMYLIAQEKLIMIAHKNSLPQLYSYSVQGDSSSYMTFNEILSVMWRFSEILPVIWRLSEILPLTRRVGENR